MQVLRKSRPHMNGSKLFRNNVPSSLRDHHLQVWVSLVQDGWATTPLTTTRWACPWLESCCSTCSASNWLVSTSADSMAIPMLSSAPDGTHSELSIHSQEITIQLDKSHKNHGNSQEIMKKASHTLILWDLQSNRNTHSLDISIPKCSSLL